MYNDVAIIHFRFLRNSMKNWNREVPFAILLEEDWALISGQRMPIIWRAR